MLTMGGLGVGMDVGSCFCCLLEDKMPLDDGGLRCVLLYRCCRIPVVLDIFPHSLLVTPINQIFFFVHDCSLHNVRTRVNFQCPLLRIPVTETKHVSEISWTTDHDRAQWMSLHVVSSPNRKTSVHSLLHNIKFSKPGQQRHPNIKSAIHHESNVH
jgi:hypothetical protein